MKISFRQPKGWSAPEKHDKRTLAQNEAGKFLCPKCSAPLSVNPGGGIYCDAVHEPLAAAVALGGMTSAKKAEAARENGKKGGRPKRKSKLRQIREFRETRVKQVQDIIDNIS